MTHAEAAQAAQLKFQSAGLLVTAATLLQRTEHGLHLSAELAAFCELSAVLATNPKAALRRISQMALKLCGAGSAGFSLLRNDSNDRPIVRWKAVSGALASHEGLEMPREISPCGLCIDADEEIIVSSPQPTFAYAGIPELAMIQCLLVPLPAGNTEARSVIWVAHHDLKRSFSANDVRIVEQLAILAALALKLQHKKNTNRRALARLEASQLAAAHEMADERLLRERVEEAAMELRRALTTRETTIVEVHHRAKNTILMAANLLSLQARRSASPEVCVALKEGYERLRVLAKVHELLYRRPDGIQEIQMPVLFQAVGDALGRAFGETSGRIKLSVTSDQIVLPTNDAIPMILLANEAITNAYKHAFPNGVAGEISVNLRHLSDHTLVLTIADNGIGMRPGIETTLGLKLIRSFAAQLRGTLTCTQLSGATGTTVTLTVPERRIRQATLNETSAVSA